MAIESDLASIKLHLSRIADAMEGLLAAQGIVVDSPTAIEDMDPPANKKGTNKKDKKNKNETVVGKTDDDEDEVKWTLPLLRAELHKLQAQENQAAVKSTLKKYGGSTLKQIDKKKYAQLAADIASQLDD